MERRLVLFPLPYIGHQNPMFELGNILHSRGFSISIIHTKFHAPNPDNYPHFSFHLFEDGLLETGTSFDELIHIINMLNNTVVDPFTECLSRILTSSSDVEPVACLITDSLWHFTQSVADVLNISRLVLRTGNMTTITMYFAMARHLLKEQDPEQPIPECPHLKFKDMSRLDSVDQSPLMEMVRNVVRESKASKGFIFNSFQGIEDQSHALVQKELSIPIFPVGPFHKWLPTQERSSISWLDTQAPNSVLFASFGSLASVDQAGFMDMAWGLANSNVPFLWVVRSDLVRSSDQSDGSSLLSDEFLQEVSGRSHIVGWAPQKAVLAHPSVGGFWTHCGWNSTLESLSEGVPMICTPSFGDQMMNTRYVTDVWRVGLRLEKGAKMRDVERVVKMLMGEAEMRQRATCLKNKATNCLLLGGPSYKYMEDLVKLIMSSNTGDVKLEF